MVYNRVGVVDLTPFAKLEVKGPDACDFMDRICANAVPKVNDPMYVILTDIESNSYFFHTDHFLRLTMDRMGVGVNFGVNQSNYCTLRV